MVIFVILNVRKLTIVTFIDVFGSTDTGHLYNPASETTSIVELQWLKHLLNHENMFKTGVLRANEC